MSHGVFSAELVLPWESADDFEKLHADFKLEWQPSGATEVRAVLELAHYTWIGQRAAKMAVLGFHQAPFGEELVKSGKASWVDIMRHEEQTPDVAKICLETISAAVRGLNALYESIRSQAFDTATSEGKEEQQKAVRLGFDLQKLIELAKTNQDLIRTVVGTITAHRTMFEKAYQPEVIEQQVKLLALIDGRIDRTLRRLMMVKEYKRITASSTPNVPLVRSPAVAPSG